MMSSGSGQSRALSSQGMMGREVSHPLSKAAVSQFPVLLQLKTCLGLGTGELIVRDLEEGLPTRESGPQWVPQGQQDVWLKASPG